MKNDVIKSWIEELRSGKYKQGKKYLNVNNEEFCCLGVLCEVLKKKIPLDINKISYQDLTLIAYNQHSSTLPHSISRQFDIYSVMQGTLTFMNDRGDSFSEIADYIEDHLITQ